MIISGFEKLTLLNYPDNIACIIFTKGCNFKCPFCHNSLFIEEKNETGSFSEEYIFEYLNKRKNVLEGVVISGGEPLIHKDIKVFIKKIKDLGFKVKLDTNGSNPNMLKELIDEELIDYVAMDIKNIFDKYDVTIGVKTNIDNIKKSIEILESSNIDYEFRTTIIKEFHTIDDIENIVNKLKKSSKYFIQNFCNSEGVLNKNLTSFTKEELINMKNKLEIKYPNIIFRDI